MVHAGACDPQDPPSRYCGMLRESPLSSVPDPAPQPLTIGEGYFEGKVKAVPFVLWCCAVQCSETSRVPPPCSRSPVVHALFRNPLS
mmetsp:Transcript_12955/g.23577  ORF Transcript_12955/g.23577 Transcript_12955/m.23577 type:complete len:87 (+) Transcript_12955:1755-2015(+)